MRWLILSFLFAGCVSGKIRQIAAGQRGVWIVAEVNKRDMLIYCIEPEAKQESFSCVQRNAKMHLDVQGLTKGATSGYFLTH